MKSLIPNRGGGSCPPLPSLRLSRMLCIHDHARERCDVHDIFLTHPPTRILGLISRNLLRQTQFGIDGRMRDTTPACSGISSADFISKLGLILPKRIRGTVGPPRFGFIITLDTIAALAFLLFIVIIISTATFKSLAPRGTYLKQISHDLLTVLEKDGSLDLLVQKNSTPARKALLAAPDSVCMSLYVITPQGQTITMISKPDCCFFRYQFQTASIAFKSKGSDYLATVESWYKKADST